MPRRFETNCAKCGDKLLVVEVDPAVRDISTGEFIRLDHAPADIEGYVLVDVPGMGEVARKVWAVVYQPHRHGNPRRNDSHKPGRFIVQEHPTDLAGRWLD